jgi:hypothetical protein
VDEDEYPKKNGRVEDVVEDLRPNEEGARAIAETEAHHLNEGKNDCKDVKLGNEYFNESYQEKRYNYNSLPLQHESPTSIFLKELSRKQSYNHLKQVEVDEY